MVSDTVEFEPVQPQPSYRVRAQVRHLAIGATLLDVALAPFWLLGWVVFWVLLFVTEASRLTFAAVRVGWADAREKAQARQIAVDRWPVRPKPPKKAAAGGPR